jgi:hypothetical protein
MAITMLVVTMSGAGVWCEAATRLVGELINQAALARCVSSNRLCQDAVRRPTRTWVCVDRVLMGSNERVEFSKFGCDLVPDSHEAIDPILVAQDFGYWVAER